MEDDGVGDAATPPPIVSFAQNAEDIRLLRVLDVVESGFFVDVGAADPSIGSVTKLFVLRGWRGINVEPGPVFADLVRQRPGDVNLDYVIGRKRGEVDFYLTFPDLGMSTLEMSVHEASLERIDHYQIVRRQQLPLQDVLEQHRPEGPIHFLKVDVGGVEGDVLASNDWARFRPWLVLVNSNAAWNRRQTHIEWEPALLGANYEFAGFDGINRFYVAEEHQRFAARVEFPISCLDRYVDFRLHEANVRLAEAEVAARDAETASRDARLARRTTSDRLTRELADAIERARAFEGERDEANRERQVALALASSQADLVAAILSSRAWRVGSALRGIAAPAKRIVAPIRKVSQGVGRSRRQRTRGISDPGSDDPKPDSSTDLSVISLPEGQHPLDQLRQLLPSPIRTLERSEAARVSVAARRLTYLTPDAAESPSIDQFGRTALNELQLACALRLDSAKRSQPALARPWATLAEVVVDARCLQDRNLRDRGVGYHARSVLGLLREVATDVRMAAILDPRLPDVDDNVRALFDATVFSPAQLDVHVTQFYLCLSPLTAGQGYSVPFLLSPSTRSATLIYDFIPAREPQRYLRDDATLLQYHSRLNVLAAFEHGLAISADTAAAAAALLEWEPRQLTVTGVVDPLPDEQGRPREPERRFVLAPTGGDERKNLRGAVAAFAIAFRKSADVDLEVLGSIPEAWVSSLRHLAEVQGVDARRLIFRSNVDPDALADAYRDADVAIVPSFAEGFSIPVVEAVRRGCPVVASDIPVHRELLGAGWWLSSPHDVPSLAKALTQAVETRAALVAAQRAHVDSRYAPDLVKERIRQVLTGLLRHRDAQPRHRVAPPRSKPRIAVIGPLPPHHSGIADYSAVTLSPLARYAALTFVPSVRGPVSADLLSVSTFRYDKLLPGKFDYVIAVMGNSHFHLSVLEYLEQFGCAVIGHDTRMVEFYDSFASRPCLSRILGFDHPLDRDQLNAFFTELDSLPASGYADIARLAAPLIVHSGRLARRIAEETSVHPLVAPFVPYNVPKRHDISPADIACARNRLGFFGSDVMHVVALGGVDTRTKGTDLVVRALAWLNSWGRRCQLHIVGDVSWPVRLELEATAVALGVAAQVQFVGRVPRSEWRDYMLAADASVQWRTASVLSLSGALADAIAYGLPTLATDALVDDHDAPFYVHSAPPRATPVLLAEALDMLRDLRTSRFAQLEEVRREYLATHTASDYAGHIAAALGLGDR